MIGVEYAPVIPINLMMEEYKKQLKFFAKPTDMSSVRIMLEKAEYELARMGLPQGDRKKFISDLAQDIQKEIDEQILKDLNAVLTGSDVSRQMGVNALEITHDFPLYIGSYSGGGVVNGAMEIINKAFMELHARLEHNMVKPTMPMDIAPYERIRQFVCFSINAWSQGMINVPFVLKVRMDSGVEREFQCAICEIIMQDAKIQLQDSTPLRIRLKIKTAIPDYLEQIDRNGKFYLTGYLDTDNQGRLDIMEVKGLGYHELHYDKTFGQAVPTNKQILLGVDV